MSVSFKEGSLKGRCPYQNPGTEPEAIERFEKGGYLSSPPPHSALPFCFSSLLHVLPLPFSPPLPVCSLTSGQATPFNPARHLGERCKLSHRVRAEPGRQTVCGEKRALLFMAIYIEFFCETTVVVTGSLFSCARV